MPVHRSLADPTARPAPSWKQRGSGQWGAPHCRGGQGQGSGTGLHLPAPPTLSPDDLLQKPCQELMAWRLHTPKGLLGPGLAWDSLGGTFRNIVPGRDCQNQWCQGCMGAGEGRR